MGDNVQLRGERQVPEVAFRQVRDFQAHAQFPEAFRKEASLARTRAAGEAMQINEAGHQCVSVARRPRWAQGATPQPYAGKRGTVWWQTPRTGLQLWRQEA